MTLTSGVSQASLDKLKEEYLKLQIEKEKRSKQAQANWTTLGMNTSNTSATFRQDPPINLDEGAWDVPISQLVDLWVIKYSSKWVKHEELDEFYSVAVIRLDKIQKIETHYVNGTNVYRIVE